MSTIPALAVVLVRTAGPVNLGLVARACANTGFLDLRLVNPLCDHLGDEARKFANHEADRLAQLPVFPDLSSAVADCGLVIGTSARPRGSDHGEPCDVRALPALMAARPCARVALVFGNESDGLNADELARCHQYLRLATPGHYSSYNVSHAVAITLHHLALEPLPAAQGPVVADTVAVERLLAYWTHTLERFRYFRRTTRERFEPQLRELLTRLPLTQHDCNVLTGMLTQFHYVQFGDKGDPAANLDQGGPCAS